MSPLQSSLFGDDEIPPLIATPAGVLRVAMPGSRRALSPEQQRFNRLVADIEATRQSWQDWQQAIDAFHAAAAATLVPLQRQLRQAQHDLVRALDALLSGPPQRIPKLTRRRREAARERLLTLVNAMLSQAQDAELVHLHDRHAPVSLAEQSALAAELTRDALASVLGEEALPEGDEVSMDDLLRSVQAHVACEQAAQEADAQKRAARRAQRRQAQGKGPTRKEREAQALVEARVEVNQSVRAVFRRLASALHPDRATDEPDRQRRHALMQRVNQAYEAQDLLALLSLQVEQAQINGADIGRLPDERVARYNLVLKEQLDLLQTQIAELSAPYFEDRGDRALRSRVARQPQAMATLLNEQVMALTRALSQVQTDTQRLNTPEQRIGLLDAWCASAANDASAPVPDMAEMARLMQVWAEEEATMAAPVRRRGRGRRRRP